MSIQVLCPFLNSIIILFLQLNCMSFFIFILDINPLSDMWFANVFSHSSSCLSNLLFALLCQSSSVWCSSVCLLWLLLAVLLVSYLINHCLDQYWASQVVLVVKNMPANAGDKKRGFDTWVRKIPWRRAWQLTPYSCLENSMDRGAWWATVHRSQRVKHDWSDIACMQDQCQASFPLYFLLGVLWFLILHLSLWPISSSFFWVV